MTEKRMSLVELRAMLENAKDGMRKAGDTSVWRHFKGGIYEVVGFDIDSVDGEVRVRYQQVAGPGYDHPAGRAVVFTRPLAEWYETVQPMRAVDDDRMAMPYGPRVPRFTPVHLVSGYAAKDEIDDRTTVTVSKVG